MHKGLLHAGTFPHRAAFTHRSFYTESLLHTDIRKHFCTKQLLHREAFTHRPFYTQTLLHTEAFTQGSLCTRLHREAFTHRSFYTGQLLHKGLLIFFTQTLFYEEQLLHTDAFTHSAASKLLQRAAFTQRRFYTLTLLHTEASTQGCLYTEQLYLSHKGTLHTQTPLHRAAYLHTEAFTQRTAAASHSTETLAPATRSETLWRLCKCVQPRRPSVQRPYGDSPNPRMPRGRGVQRPATASHIQRLYTETVQVPAGGAAGGIYFLTFYSGVLSDILF